MGGRTLLAATLLISGTAYAQAPGDYSGDASGAPGMVEPQQPPLFVEPPCDCIRNVMANRWAVGLSIGSFAVTSDSYANADPTQFDVGELSLRLRATPHFELEFAIGGGHENVGDGYESDISIRTVAINARYRFMIHSHWNWWLMGGIGAVSIAPDSASDDVVDANQRPMFQAGVGLEHRWEQFAIQAEVRASTIGPTKDANQVQPDGTIGRSSDDTYSGGAFTLGAAYYF